MPLSPQSRLAPQAHVAIRKVNDGTVVVDLKTGECFRMNAVGTYLWERIALGDTINTAVQMLQTRYQVSHEVLQADAIRLCSALLAAGLISDRNDEG